MVLPGSLFVCLLVLLLMCFLFNIYKMKFLTFAFVINFILVCWPKLDIIINQDNPDLCPCCVSV